MYAAEQNHGAMKPRVRSDVKPRCNGTTTGALRPQCTAHEKTRGSGSRDHVLLRLTVRGATTGQIYARFFWFKAQSEIPHLWDGRMR